MYRLDVQTSIVQTRLDMKVPNDKSEEQWELKKVKGQQCN